MNQISEKIKKLHLDILYPTVMVGTGKDNGSGVVIYSKKKKGNSRWETYIITNYHVIAWTLKAKPRRKINITFFKYKRWSENIGNKVISATVVTYDRKRDLALLKLYSKEKYIAKLHSKNINNVYIFDEVYTCGCSLTYPPVITSGHISGLDNYQWLVTSPITDGNSGGGVYLKNGQLIGISCEVGVNNEIEVNYLCFLVPINSIYDFLEKKKFQFIYDSKFTSAQCEKMRKRKK
ncbi:MAG: trypsin-like peptidase domain-containing protein [Candidatus Cloacimonetes bacterium]|nr:trypsin-like peptidase domain-containing protein [Candidatus Cloacimonadota bacterium]